MAVSMLGNLKIPSGNHDSDIVSLAMGKINFSPYLPFNSQAETWAWCKWGYNKYIGSRFSHK